MFQDLQVQIKEMFQGKTIRNKLRVFGSRDQAGWGSSAYVGIIAAIEQEVGQRVHGRIASMASMALYLDPDNYYCCSEADFSRGHELFDYFGVAIMKWRGG